MEKASSSIFSSEDLWSEILSQDREAINRVFEFLDADASQNIKSHLEKIISEDGWHPSQKASASFALGVINDLETKGD